MSARCKPGDIAIVVSATHHENLGAIVRVIEPHDGTGDICWRAVQCQVWLVESSKPMLWNVKRAGERVFLARHRGPVPDDRLQPIRGVAPPKATSVSLPEGWFEQAIANFTEAELDELREMGWLRKLPK